MVSSMNKNSYLTQTLIILLLFGFCFIGLAVLEALHLVNAIERGISDFVLMLVLYSFFYRLFERFDWSVTAKRLSYIPVFFVTLDCLIEIIHEIEPIAEIPILGKNSLFVSVFDDSFLILIILSLLSFFVYLFTELEDARQAYKSKSTDLKDEIEKRKRIEKRRQQEQQFEIVGELAGGIAHEFNNILTIIIGNLSIASLHVNPENKSSIDKSLASAERASDLVKKLLSFSRQTKMQFSKVQLTNILDHYHKIANNAVGELTKIQITKEENLPEIYADESRIFFILMQLTKNSNDAIEAKRQCGGYQEGEEAIISYDVKSVTITPEDIIPNSNQKSGKYIILTISDNGFGIPEENKTKLFLPFFTTKKVGEGVGLDLAEVKGVIEQHNGWIEFSSKQNVYTEFRIYLPVATEQVMNDLK